MVETKTWAEKKPSHDDNYRAINIISIPVRWR